MLLNNRYRILSTLGSGGFGETYLAEDTQMPSQRRCVIKQLNVRGSIVKQRVNQHPKVLYMLEFTLFNATYASVAFFS
jgi:serine/threonine protein kinase